MASQTGDAKTLLDGEPSTLADVTDVHGRLRVLSDTRNFDTELAATETFTMPQMPKGARAHGLIVSTAAGAGALVNVGTTSNATLFGAALDWGTAAAYIPLNGAAATAQEDVVLAETVGTSALVAGGNVRITLLYSLD